MKLPHTLRVIILMLRVALGLNFFYLGLGALFDPGVGSEVRAHSFSDLYAWLSAPAGGGWVHPFAQWAFLIIGICLVLGLLTRVVSIAGVILTLLSYLPTVSYTTLSLSQFISDEVLVVICLLIIIVSGAGTYIGLDSFIHFHAPAKTK